jgi:hypothetical protein
MGVKKKENLIFNLNKNASSWGCSSVVGCLPNMHMGLASHPSTGGMRESGIPKEKTQLFIVENLRHTRI